MTDFYLSPVGNDSNTGSIASPWRTLTKAFGAPTGSTVYVVGGAYAAPGPARMLPITLVALEPVLIGSAIPQPVWTLVTLGAYPVWHATVSMTHDARNATWTDAAGVSHRIPLWTHTAPLFDTALHWAETVLNPDNLHTRWGLWSTTTDLYVIPPVDGSWTDPNAAHVTVSSADYAIGATGPDFTMSGPFTVVGHAQGVRTTGATMRMHLDGLTFRNNGMGINVVGTLPLVYGHDHLIERCRFEDDLTSLAEGQTAVPHQMLSWNLVKSTLSFGIKNAAGALITCSRGELVAESVGFRSEGGSINTVVRDCVFDGTFDGASHYQSPGRYDAQADGNLLITDCTFTNIADDVFDRAGYQDHVRIENITARNVGVCFSPAPLWGTVSIKNMHASRIGDQVRVADGNGARPHGSVVKYGTADMSSPHGVVNIEDSVFWTDNPTTQGLCPDGGDGNNVPTFNIARSTIRVGGIVLNWGSSYPHPAEWLTLDDTVLATSGPQALKTNLTGIVVEPVAEVDAFYYDPAAGNFEEADVIAELEQQVTDLQTEVVRLRTLIEAKQEADFALAHAFDEAA